MTPLETLTEAIRTRRVAFRRLVDGSGILLEVETGRVITLNETAMRLVELVAEGETTLDGLVGRMEAEFEVDADTLRRDIHAVVGEVAGALAGSEG